MRRDSNASSSSPSGSWLCSSTCVLSLLSLPFFSEAGNSKICCETLEMLGIYREDTNNSLLLSLSAYQSNSKVLALWSVFKRHHRKKNKRCCVQFKCYDCSLTLGSQSRFSRSRRLERRRCEWARGEAKEKKKTSGTQGTLSQGAILKLIFLNWFLDKENATVRSLVLEVLFRQSGFYFVESSGKERQRMYEISFQ